MKHYFGKIGELLWNEAVVSCGKIGELLWNDAVVSCGKIGELLWNDAMFTRFTQQPLLSAPPGGFKSTTRSAPARICG